MKFLGSFLIMLWFALLNGADRVIPTPYASYGAVLVNYKWVFLVFGVLLSVYGFVTGIKKRRQLNNALGIKRDKNKIQKKNFVIEQKQYLKTGFVKESNFKNKELALKVDWTPLIVGGTHFKTNKLVTVNTFRIEVLRSFTSYFISVSFIVMGVGMSIAMGSSTYKNEGFNGDLVIAGCIGLSFVLSGVVLLFFPKPRVFDKRMDWFWVGKKSLNREQDLMQLKKSARLSEIAAIQILSERLSGKNGSYTSWEINLVSRDAKRLNVLDHGNKQSVIEDAQLLGDFLSVPVWENA